ncbi:MAG: hypothetical protein [Bacteriophage sp.]|nr:MAG: hypothetical protein [Bacteriophage sp.]
MTQSKQMDSRTFALKQATNIAKEAINQIIADALINVQNSKGKKNEKVVLNKKQFCAGIQFLKMLHKPFLDDLGSDTQEAKDLMDFIDDLDRTIKIFWALMGDDDTINVPFEIPDLSE